jgi:hypothetical protein
MLMGQSHWFDIGLELKRVNGFLEALYFRDDCGKLGVFSLKFGDLTIQQAQFGSLRGVFRLELGDFAVFFSLNFLDRIDQCRQKSRIIHRVQIALLVIRLGDRFWN